MKLKKVAALGMAALMAASLGACGGSGEGDGGAKADSKSLTVWIEKVFSDEANTAMEERIKSFAEENDVNVNYEFISATDFVTKLNAAIEAGSNIPDITTGAVTKVVNYYPSNPYMDVTDLVDEINAERPYMQSIYEGSKIEGKNYFVPMTSSSTMMFIRKEKLEEAGITEVPETWDEVYDALKKIKEAGIVEYPYTMPMNADESATTSMMWMAFSRSGQVFNDDDTLNEEAVMDALTFENQLVQDGFVDPASISFNGMDCYRKITSGEASFMVGPTKFVGISNDPEQCSEIGNIVPILLPGTDGTSPQTMALPEAVGITSFSENKEAAQEFVKWYSSADVQKRMYAVNSSIPTRNSVLAEMVEDGTFENAGAMLDEADLIKSVFPNGVPSYYSEMSNTMYNNINQMVLGEQTPQEAFDAMNAKVNELIEKK